MLCISTQKTLDSIVKMSEKTFYWSKAKWQTSSQHHFELYLFYFRNILSLYTDQTGWLVLLNHLYSQQNLFQIYLSNLFYIARIVTQFTNISRIPVYGELMSLLWLVIAHFLLEYSVKTGSKTMSGKESIILITQHWFILSSLAFCYPFPPPKSRICGAFLQICIFHIYCISCLLNNCTDTVSDTDSGIRDSLISLHWDTFFFLNTYCTSSTAV